MKFTSVILALSAVVAMVHAAPLPDLPDTTKTVGGIGGGVGDVLPAGTLRKRFVDDVPPGVDLPVGPKSVSLAKRDLNKAIPTDFSIIQNTFQTVANDAGINLENALYAQVTTVLQEKFHLEITDIVNIDIQGEKSGVLIDIWLLLFFFPCSRLFEMESRKEEKNPMC